MDVASHPGLLSLASRPSIYVQWLMSELVMVFKFWLLLWKKRRILRNQQTLLPGSVKCMQCEQWTVLICTEVADTRSAEVVSCWLQIQRLFTERRHDFVCNDANVCRSESHQQIPHTIRGRCGPARINHCFLIFALLYYNVFSGRAQLFFYLRFLAIFAALYSLIVNFFLSLLQSCILDKWYNIIKWCS